MSLMPRSIDVRKVQAALGAAYATLAAIAVWRSPGASSVAIAAAMAVGAYLTGRVVPTARLPMNNILRVCGLGLLVLAGGIVAELAGGHRTLGWASVVMAYCAGNRLKAAGIGLSRA